VSALVRNLAVLTVLLVVVLNVTSSFLRHAKSGLECIERPVCYQQVGVSGQPILFAEDESPRYHVVTVIHRVIASVIAVFVLIINIMLFRKEGGAPLPKRLAFVMGAAVLWLAGLGAATGGSLALMVVMGNQLGGLLLLVVSTLLVVLLLGWELQWSLKKVMILAGGVMLFTLFVQGGMVSSSFAGMACTTLPDCNGEWWSNNPLIQMHIMHRFSALVALLYFGAMLLRAVRRGESFTRNFLLLLLVMLFVQIQLGVVMVEQQLPLLITSLHSLFSQLLIAMVTVYLFVSGARVASITDNTSRGQL